MIDNARTMLQQGADPGAVADWLTQQRVPQQYWLQEIRPADVAVGDRRQKLNAALANGAVGITPRAVSPSDVSTRMGGHDAGPPRFVTPPSRNCRW